MVMQSVIIKFTDTPEEELDRITQELHLASLVPALRNNSIPADVQEDLGKLLFVLVDMFGKNVPAIDADDPLETLRTASRDINLGRILRERGIFRVYRLLKERVVLPESKQEVPLYMSLVNPETEQPFNRQEDFVFWFCREAKVSRATLFQRLAAIDKLRALGNSLEKSYSMLLQKPGALENALETVSVWEKGKLVDIRPNVAERLVERHDPEKSQRVHALAAILEDPETTEEQWDEAQEELLETVKPALASLVEEVAYHPNVKDALDYVRHDVAAKPEISYRWDYEKELLVIELVRKNLDPRGQEYIADIFKINMAPDPLMPNEIREDLFRRLPMKNRERLDG